jgi:hypothetical protein
VNGKGERSSLGAFRGASVPSRGGAEPRSGSGGHRRVPNTDAAADATPSVAAAPMTKTPIPPTAAPTSPPAALNTESSSICSGVISSACRLPSRGLFAAPPVLMPRRVVVARDEDAARRTASRDARSMAAKRARCVTSRERPETKETCGITHGRLQLQKNCENETIFLKTRFSARAESRDARPVPKHQKKGREILKTVRMSD